MKESAPAEWLVFKGVLAAIVLYGSGAKSFAEGGTKQSTCESFSLILNRAAIFCLY
jgi:hypothetical protein